MPAVVSPVNQSSPTVPGARIGQTSILPPGMSFQGIPSAANDGQGAEHFNPGGQEATSDLFGEAAKMSKEPDIVVPPSGGSPAAVQGNVEGASQNPSKESGADYKSLFDRLSDGTTEVKTKKTKKKQLTPEQQKAKQEKQKQQMQEFQKAIMAFSTIVTAFSSSSGSLSSRLTKITSAVTTLSLLAAEYGADGTPVADIVGSLGGAGSGLTVEKLQEMGIIPDPVKEAMSKAMPSTMR